jgi:hypothetical protein
MQLCEMQQITDCRALLHDLLTNPNTICFEVFEGLKDFITQWIQSNALGVYAEPQLHFLLEEVIFCPF